MAVGIAKQNQLGSLLIYCNYWAIQVEGRGENLNIIDTQIHTIKKLMKVVYQNQEQRLKFTLDITIDNSAILNQVIPKLFLCQRYNICSPDF